MERTLESKQHRIVVIDEEFPFPLDSGKRIRSYNLLSRLASRCKVHYLAFGSTTSEAFAHFERNGMNPIAVDAPRPSLSGPMFYVRLLRNLLSSDPYIVARHRSERFKVALEKEIACLEPDGILCEWTPYASYFEAAATACKITVAHNIEHTIWQRYWEHAGQGPKKWYIAEQARRVARFEAWAFGASDAAIAVSESEAGEIARLNPAIPVKVVENGVDLDFFQPGMDPEIDETSPSLVFVGAMNWRPNQDAMQYFVTSIWPKLQAKHPDVTLSIVGQDPPAFIERLAAGKGIRVLGRVDDVRPYVREATVYVVPLRIGGGTRLKILEALAMEKAIVSTSVGAEGLEVRHGHDILLADNPDAFAQSVDALILDSGQRRRLGKAGRRLVEQRYGWDALADKQWGFIESVLARKAMSGKA